jgi:hypothetical protein
MTGVSSTGVGSFETTGFFAPLRFGCGLFGLPERVVPRFCHPRRLERDMVFLPVFHRGGADESLS